MRLRPRVRVDVLSGFLGSGKTTLLRSHLGAIEATRVAVVINEFGATSIDHRLLRLSGDEVKVLANGCACCAVAERLRSALLDLLRDDAKDHSNTLSRIVLETSGLADPAAVLNTIRSDENLEEYLSIGSCLVTFDALEGVTCAQTYPEVSGQLAGADTIVITKADVATPEQVGSALSFVRIVNPLAAISISGTVGFDVAHLFEGPNRTRPMERKSAPAHSGQISSFSLQVEGAIDWASFSVWLTCLLNRHGSRILRFKAVLDVGADQLPLVVHGVRHLVYPPQHLPAVEADHGRSDLVFIVDGLDAGEIESSLHRFLRFAAVAAVGKPVNASIR